MSKDNHLANYVTVAERVADFYVAHPEGRILTAIIEHDRAAGFIVMRAEVYRRAEDSEPAASGHAHEVRGEGHVNKTSYVENAETSAVGRALQLLGLETKRTTAARPAAARATQPASAAGASAAPAPPPPRFNSLSESQFTFDLTGESPRVFDDRKREVTDPTVKRKLLVAEIERIGHAVGKSRTAIDLKINQQMQTSGGLDALSFENLRKTLTHYRDLHERMRLLADMQAFVSERKLEAQLTAIMVRDYEGRAKEKLTVKELQQLVAALEREAAEHVF